MKSVEEKWNKLSEEDRLYVEQIINQLLNLEDFQVNDDEFKANLQRLEDMKSQPNLHSKDGFQAISDIKSKIINAKN